MQLKESYKDGESELIFDIGVEKDSNIDKHFPPIGCYLLNEN